MLIYDLNRRTPRLAGIGALLACNIPPQGEPAGAMQIAPPPPMESTVAAVAESYVDLHGPFGPHDFPAPPTTWYCLSPWNTVVAEQQRGMELFAWATFISVNWPGTLDPETTRWRSTYRIGALNEASIYPQWIDWFTHRELTREIAGEPPDVAPTTSRWECKGDCPSTELVGPGFMSDGEPHRAVYDQSGAQVQYEVRSNMQAFRILHENLAESDLKSLDRKSISFTYGQCKGRGYAPSGDQKQTEGATNIKLAWKVLTPEEHKSGRFLLRRIEPDAECKGADCTEPTVLGLVGLHIAQKSNHYPDWIWATFEHVDNLVAPPGATRASFRDTACEGATCCANTSQQEQGSAPCRTQIEREPPPPEVRTLNERIQQWLRDKGSVLQYYEMIGVQFRPFTPGVAEPDPLPPTLRNATIETYRVPQPASACVSARPICGGRPVGEASSCIGCHDLATPHDMSFVITRALCDCEDHEPWVSSRCQRQCPP